MEYAPSVYLKDVSPEALQLELQQIPAGMALIVFVAEGGKPDLERISQTLNLSGYQYAGALFPRILHGNQVYEEGLIIVPLKLKSPPITINGLGNGLFNLHDLPDVTEMQGHSLFILLDGLSKHIADFLRRLYGHFGTQVIYVGGGAGSLSLQQAPCVFSNAGVAQDQAIVIPLQGQIKLGVHHGWRRLMGPLIATEVDKNTVKQINWQPAFSVYRDVIEKETEKTFTKNNFFDIAKGYPFGLEKDDAEDIVRDPIAVTDDGALVCVGEVPENAIIHILKGETDALTKSARMAAEASTEQNTGPLKLPLIVDCISRILFLGEKFSDELEQINQVFESHGGDYPAVGVMTLGEISSMGDGFLEFLNKSVVIGTQD